MEPQNAVHRARFCWLFTPVGIFKMPPGTLLQENRGRRRAFHLSTGRTSENQHGFAIDTLFVYGLKSDGCKEKKNGQTLISEDLSALAPEAGLEPATL